MKVKKLSELNGNWDETELCYLAEASSVGEDGTVRGKGLKAYEVRIRVDPLTSSGGLSFGNFITMYPTGFVYIYNKGKYERKVTNATLSNKRINEYDRNLIKSSVKDHLTYGSTLYTTPQLAIAAKAVTIMDSKKKRVKEMKDALIAIEKNTKPYENIYGELLDEYPEYFI